MQLHHVMSVCKQFDNIFKAFGLSRYGINQLIEQTNKEKYVMALFCQAYFQSAIKTKI